MVGTAYLLSYFVYKACHVISWLASSSRLALFAVLISLHVSSTAREYFILSRLRGDRSPMVANRRQSSLALVEQTESSSIPIPTASQHLWRTVRGDVGRGNDDLQLWKGNLYRGKRISLLYTRHWGTIHGPSSAQLF
ncbi:hypothetical protein BD289DRAFT_429975 [Coniella lustricola]|uniref:Uncharacterized protein n=1 Tax=Coniella lustricola TaxID=2025994 RepID=A0A2T3ACI7_9PEZI|nr:hypothetical protein BD289DRAFT_429975 [Coniella lustricola]